MSGGAVRDALLGLPVKDRDWVVVGSTPEEMLARGPPGRPRFSGLPASAHQRGICARAHRAQVGPRLHRLRLPRLARGHARRGPAAPRPHHQRDRARRGRPPDRPCGGRRDLAARVFRHVARLRRGSAAHPAWRASPALHRLRAGTETLELMRAMVVAGEVDHLVAERLAGTRARAHGGAPLAMIRVLRAAAHSRTPAARARPPVPGSRSRRSTTRDRHRRARADGARPRRRRGRAARGALGPPAARPRQGRHARVPAAAPLRATRPASARRARGVGTPEGPADCRDLAEMVAREHDIRRARTSCAPKPWSS